LIRWNSLDASTGISKGRFIDLRSSELQISEGMNADISTVSPTYSSENASIRRMVGSSERMREDTKGTFSLCSSENLVCLPIFFQKRVLGRSVVKFIFAKIRRAGGGKERGKGRV